MASGCAADFVESDEERKEGAAWGPDDLARMISRSSKSSSMSEISPSLGSESLTSSICGCDMAVSYYRSSEPEHDVASGEVVGFSGAEEINT